MKEKDGAGDGRRETREKARSREPWTRLSIKI